MRSLTRAIADPYSDGSLSAWARSRRWSAFAKRFRDIATMRVLDLGGDLRSWEGSGVRPLELTVVNIVPQHSDEDWVNVVVGDVCSLPSEVARQRFDLVYSNSVIEHLGGHWRRAAFADAVHALAPRHWIQTPYRYFPLEPHWLFPGFQFLPLRARAEVTRRWPLGHRRVAALGLAVDSALSVELLSETELRSHFPESEIERERVLGLPKSLIAVQDGFRAPAPRPALREAVPTRSAERHEREVGAPG